MKFKKSLSLLTLTLIGALQAHAGDLNWQSETLWASAVQNNLDFFDRHAWDANLGSYASEIDVSGTKFNENRDVVALSRMIYANAKAPGALQNLDRARKISRFLLKNMTAKDEHGLFFKSVVNEQGEELSSGRSYVFVFEQAYPISGLVALYQSDPARNGDLLPIIRYAAKSFWKRFQDPVSGGLFYYYNFTNQNHANDEGQVHKSYQSTIYPISSFLLSLRKVDPGNRDTYDSWIRELLSVAANHIVEQKNGVATGWLIERMVRNFEPDTGYLVTEAGHITQLAWVLGTAISEGVVQDSTERRNYTRIARTLLSKFLDHGGMSPIGVVYDAFNRSTGQPWTEGQQHATSAWWSNLEAIIAYAFAVKHHLLGSERVEEMHSILNQLSKAYFTHFVDHEQGGEFFRVDATTGEVVDSTKGGPGKSGYHIGETYDFLFGEAGLAR